MGGEKGEIVVISSGAALAHTLRLQWEPRGLAVRGLPESALVPDPAELEHAALVVVDLDSARGGGLALCNRLAEEPATPFIVLLPGPDPELTTAVLDRGAVDCLARPFNPQELSLRIRAILRRTGTIPPAANGAGQRTGEEREELMAKKPKLARPSRARCDREADSSYPRRGPRWTTFAFVVLGILIAVSVLVASLGLGTGITTGQQASNGADLEQVVAPLLERLQQNPADEAAMVALGNAYYDSDRWEEAVPWYEKALQATPENTDVRTDLGTAYFYSGDLAKAKEQWSKVLEQDPDKVQAHYNMGLLYLHQSPADTESAAREWETVIKLAPGTEEAESAQERLTSLAKR